MFKAEKSINIRGTLEEIYGVAETYPKFVSFYKKKEILFESEDRMVVRISSSFYGKELGWEGEGIKDRYKSINFAQTQGLLKGLKATWFFEDLKDNRVRVTIRSHLEFQFFLGRFLEWACGVLLIENTLSKILSSLKCTVEKQCYQ